MVGLGSSNLESNAADVSKVAREIRPSEGGRDGTSLNVGSGIIGEKPNHSGLGPHNARELVRVNLLGEVFELRNSPPDVVQDICSRTERNMVNCN